MTNEPKELFYNFDRNRQISITGPNDKGRFLLQVKRPGEKEFCTCNLSLDEIHNFAHSLMSYAYEALKIDWRINDI